MLDLLFFLWGKGKLSGKGPHSQLAMGDGFGGMERHSTRNAGNADRAHLANMVRRLQYDAKQRNKMVIFDTRLFVAPQI